MAVTLKDIAKRTNLSTATVSRVINNTQNVSNDTRIKVENAIHELNYQPNGLDGFFMKKGLKTVGLLIPDMNVLFFPKVIMGIEDELEKNDYNIFLCNTYESIEKEKKYMTSLLAKGVNGILFLGFRPNKLTNELILELSRQIPIVLINDYILGSNVYSVMTDEVIGAYKATNYLISLGHNKIAMVNGNTEYTTWRYKYRGYSKALMDSKMEINEEYIINVKPYEEGGYKGAKKLLSLEDPPTAIFTATDQIAIGVMKAIYEENYSIPSDISLIGFTDTPIAAHLFPGLTTVNQFPYKTGQLSAEMIMKAINEEEIEQRRIILEPQLIIRESCTSR